MCSFFSFSFFFFLVENLLLMTITAVMQYPQEIVPGLQQISNSMDAQVSCVKWHHFACNPYTFSCLLCQLQ